MMTDSIRGIDIAVSLMQEALSLLDGPKNVAIAEWSAPCEETPYCPS